MKRLLNMMGILTLVLAAGCGHYVATHPSQPVVVVPPSPGPEYVWVGGAWRWNGGARAYRWNNGYWAQLIVDGNTSPVIGDNQFQNEKVSNSRTS